MKYRLLIASLVLGYVVGQPGRWLGASDWPMYRADAARSGYCTGSLPQDLQLLWKHESRAAPQPAWPSSSRITFDFVSHPIMVGELVVFGSSSENKIVAIDAATGQVRWTFLTGGPVRLAPAAAGGRLFVGSDDGYLYALRADDGALDWKIQGGPNQRMALGNGRMISRWPIRGGPVVFGDTVYFAAGIWPSENVYLHAVETGTGKPVWTNDRTGRRYMPQPHGGANAHSGVAPQGYLLATEDRIFVPTGRAVPAAFDRRTGRLDYYRLQQNGSIGGARALIADRFVVNAGCLLPRENGNLAARVGRGVVSVLPDGILQSDGKTLNVYRWADLQTTDRRGNTVRYRGLARQCQVTLESDSAERQQVERVLDRLPALKDVYQMQARFQQAYENVPRQTGLERTVAQARPEIEALGYRAAPFLATRYERICEVIAVGGQAICGGRNVVRMVELDGQAVRWSHQVEGDALGLAAANGRLVVSTTKGLIYCFGRPGAPAASGTAIAAETTRPAPSPRGVDYGAVADEILRKSGITEGFCLDLGCDDGRLDQELATRSRLHVIGVDSDPNAVARARRRLDEAGLYGTRVTIDHGDPSHPPCPRNFANLVISSRAIAGQMVLASGVIEQMQRPFGGVVCQGKPGDLQVRRRGPLPGAGRWTHQNCDAANTLCCEDRRVRGPLEVSWYRGGVLTVPDRHAQGPAPLASNGYLVVEGVDGICALDAYNGRTLWTYPIPGILADWNGVHHDVGVGDTGSNFCLSDDAVFVRVDNRCLKIDLATGRKVREFKTPVAASARDRAWGYIAWVGGMLYGSVLNDEHTVSPRYKNIRLRTESVLLFAFDAQQGNLRWQYRPQHSIRNNTIAIAAERVYFVDRPLALEDRITDPRPGRKHRPLLKPGQQPGGMLLALDATTGAVQWKNDKDIFGTQLAVSTRHGVILMYYQAVRHSFFKLPSEVGGRLAALSSATGQRLWDNHVQYTTRPLINDNVIYAEGGAWRLDTGKPLPWTLKRSYGCGQIAGSTFLMLFRSATLGYLDLSRDVGTEDFGGLRPGCWLNAIPAAGLVLAPDGSSQCACSYQTQAWLALQPREEDD